MPYDLSRLPADLAHAVTRFDRARASRRGYNPNALALYLERAAEVAAEVADGASVRAAVSRGFNDRLRDSVLAYLEEREAFAAEGDSDVFNVDTLDPVHAAGFDPAKPWIHEGDGFQEAFETEREACAAQRAHRERMALDPMTGEA